MKISLTETQQLFIEFCKKNNFVNEKEFNDFKTRLEEENNSKTISFALENFVEATCPKCGAYGFYKSKAFGKLTHSACNISWYMSPGKYILHQIGWLLKSGSSPNKESEGRDIFAKIFGFLIPFIFRFPFAVLSIPIQIILSLVNSKSSKTKH